ncbi:hypothetical protein ALC60_09737 [Trachymyrmex zeteki]|uniref:Uncharacterized protein n=1 Tax=Mycetomoellerius zeteki TaxID=64791 RepID=A0A151WTT9_9HYME|nr:hypothetical protein ALC60_09737 [Trachymyrmex zeteki]
MHDTHDDHHDPPSSARILRLSAISKLKIGAPGALLDSQTRSDRPPFHETSARSKWHDVNRVEPTAVVPPAPPRRRNATRAESN